MVLGKNKILFEKRNNVKEKYGINLYMNRVEITSTEYDIRVPKSYFRIKNDMQRLSSV